MRPHSRRAPSVPCPRCSKRIPILIDDRSVLVVGWPPPGTLETRTSCLYCMASLPAWGLRLATHRSAEIQ